MDKGAGFLQVQEEKMLGQRGSWEGGSNPHNAEGRLGAEKTEVEEQGLRTQHH